jgi:hypothetical protein
MKMRILSAFGAAAVLVGLSLPASAQSAAPAASPVTAVTPVLPDETISGVSSLTLPTPPVLPAKFTLPIEVKVVKDASITTNTPITDQYGSDYAKWGETVRAALRSKPILVRVVGDETVPFVVGGSEGKIKLNANDRPVYPL